MQRKSAEGLFLVGSACQALMAGWLGLPIRGRLAWFAEPSVRVSWSCVRRATGGISDRIYKCETT